jgi:excisionase family DNA binding protein
VLKETIVPAGGPLSKREAMAWLKVSETTLEKHVKNGAIRAYKVGPKKYLFMVPDLQAFVNRSATIPIEAK